MWIGAIFASRMHAACLQNGEVCTRHRGWQSSLHHNHCCLDVLVGQEREQVVLLTSVDSAFATAELCERSWTFMRSGAFLGTVLVKWITTQIGRASRSLIPCVVNQAEQHVSIAGL